LGKKLPKKLRKKLFNPRYKNSLESKKSSKLLHVSYKAFYTDEKYRLDDLYPARPKKKAVKNFPSGI